MQTEISNILQDGAEIARNMGHIASWETLTTDGKGRVLMELRHDAEDLLKSVKLLEERIGSN